VDGSDAGSETRRVRVFGHRNEDLDVVGCRPSLELRSCLRALVRQIFLIFLTVNPDVARGDAGAI
jgi:c-di-AMP phosphodiesterase-like protein